MKKYGLNFTKALLGTFGWATGLLVLTQGIGQLIPSLLIALGCGVIAASVFTVGYPIVWESQTLNKWSKVAASAVMNIVGGSLVIGLVYPDMLLKITPWTPAMLVLSFGIHALCTNFYTPTKLSK